MRREVRMTVAVFHRHLSVDRMRHDPGSGERHHAFDLREIDELALAGKLCVDQSGEHGRASIQSADGVAERRVAHNRRPIGIADNARQARALLECRTIGATIAIDAACAEGRHRHHHELWIDLAQHLIAESEFRQYLDGIIVDDEIRVGQQLPRKTQAPRPCQIERDPPLVAVHDAVAHRFLVHLLEDVGRAPIDAAPPIRILDRFDLDHVGAEIGQRARANRTGPAHREIDNTHAFERKPARIARPRRRSVCASITGTTGDGLRFADRRNRPAASRRRVGQSLH